jgi:hypothetical protein
MAIFSLGTLYKQNKFKFWQKRGSIGTNGIGCNGKSLHPPASKNETRNKKLLKEACHKTPGTLYNVKKRKNCPTSFDHLCIYMAAAVMYHAQFLSSGTV